MHEEVSLPCSLGVPDSGGIGALRNEQVRLKTVDVGRSQMPIREWIEVSRVHHWVALVLDVEHAGSQ